jgi:hypothetical protein
MTENANYTDQLVVKAAPFEDWVGGPQNQAVTSNVNANRALRASMNQIKGICLTLLQSGECPETTLHQINAI